MKRRAQNIFRFLLLSLVVFFTSCKSTKIITDGNVNEKLSAKSVIKAHYQGQSRFETLRGRVKMEYSNGEENQSYTVSIRMQKDKGIWISAPLGIVKAYITPQRVSFYNKLENEYFDGDFSYLSELLGTQVDFDMLQNLLLGQAIVDLRNERYTLTTANNGYQLTPKEMGSLYKLLFQVEPQNFKMALQQLSQPEQQRLLQIKYENYQNVERAVLPNEIHITTVDGASENAINLEFRNMELNQRVNFPYNIPKGFKEIVLK
jgi:outer membrane lipoprotein-sorting protein